MIIARTPLRVSFLGGGTDFPEYFEQHGGAVLATAIDKYSYVSVVRLNDFFQHKIRVSYSKTELVTSVDEIQHRVFREALNQHGIRSNIEIHHISDLPARTGLGSSSSFAVCLLHALYVYSYKLIDLQTLAYDAIHLEREVLKENVGCQDQTVAANGGFQFVEFRGSQDIRCNPVIINPTKKRLLNESLMMFYTGIERSASEISREQLARIAINVPYLNDLKHLAIEGKKDLEGSADHVDNFGKILNEGWRLKRTLSSKVSNSMIDEIYDVGLRSGAIGGKLLGAGSGGFILFLVPPEKKEALRKALVPLKEVKFNFEPSGSQIIYYKPE